MMIEYFLSKVVELHPTTFFLKRNIFQKNFTVERFEATAFFECSVKLVIQKFFAFTARWSVFVLKTCFHELLRK